MPLELKLPEDDEKGTDIVSTPDGLHPPVTLAGCEEHDRACRLYIDGLTADLREQEQYLGLPPATVRFTLTKGQIDIAAAPRLLREAQQRKQREQQQ